MNRIYATLILVLLSVGAQAQTTVNTTSQAQTAATGTATNAGNSQGITFNNEAPSDHSSLKTNPTVYAPSPTVSYSPLNCANGVSAGASGGYVGIAFGTAKEGDQCNGRANSTMLMQMGNNLRPFDATRADKLYTAAINLMCDQDDKIRAKLVAQGLCDTSDYSGNERNYGQNKSASKVYYPNTGG